MESLEELKYLCREKQVPFFEDDELLYQLEKPTGTSLSRPTAACSSRRKTARYRFPA